MNEPITPTPAPTPRTDAAKISISHIGAHSESEWNMAETILNLQEQLAAKDAEIEAFKANNRYMRGHTAGYEEAESKYKARVTELERQLAEAGEDKARLELVEAKKFSVSWNDRFDGFIVQRKDQVVSNIGHARTLTLRAALSAAKE